MLRFLQRRSNWTRFNLDHRVPSVSQRCAATVNSTYSIPRFVYGNNMSLRRMQLWHTFIDINRKPIGIGYQRHNLSAALNDPKKSCIFRFMCVRSSAAWMHTMYWENVKQQKCIWKQYVENRREICWKIMKFSTLLLIGDSVQK